MKVFELFPSDIVSLVALRINRSRGFGRTAGGVRSLHWGILRQNKPYIPEQIAANKLRPEYSSLFNFHERNVALCSYVLKKNEAVILLSTMLSDTAVNVDEQKKPHMIMYYNKYKTGVDTIDQW